MTELLPSDEAANFRASLVDYLTTTFAFADEEAERELNRLLNDPAAGIFRGPYARLRMPFRPALDGWQELLGWTPEHRPHAHQAEAWRRLTSRDLGDNTAGPHPTLVTTGTGSGKTEAFLYPILDHVMRAKAAGQGGVKALILYPMNALANDQARRIAELISTVPQLAGVRAALYTGQKGKESSRVTAEMLITSREAIRDEAPDILLTNYKMLDQLLLRREDRGIWRESAESLRYLVLDEFHTYDGAQGTDVAMLLRRLGLVIERELPANGVIDAEAGPLGRIVPVATSATLGDKGDPEAMLTFAHTVFGVTFPPESVVTETRISVEEWASSEVEEQVIQSLLPAEFDNRLVQTVNEKARAAGDDIVVRTTAILSSLFHNPQSSRRRAREISIEEVLAGGPIVQLVKAHPSIRSLISETSAATHLDDLAERILPRGYLDGQSETDRAAARREFLTNLLAALSHIRATAGFGQSPDISVHLWVRELTRMDRRLTPQVSLEWSDDGETAIQAGDEHMVERMPALFCRHCGRSGWGVQMAPTGNDLDVASVDPRAKRVNGDGRFRALIYAPREQETFENGTEVDGLHWIDPIARQVLSEPNESDSLLPVLAIMDDHAEEASREDQCPSCGRVQGIRFVGSALATMLSVAVTTLFGEASLDNAEKKSLIFTDSVQDAAHRAGFVQSRGHVFALRNAIYRAVSRGGLNLSDTVDSLMEHAETPAERYLLLGPDIADNDRFSGYWDSTSEKKIPALISRKVRRRLMLDVSFEFGLRSKVGRTLELTGAVAAGVSAGSAKQLEAIGRKALQGATFQAEFLAESTGKVSSEGVLRWVRGVLERLRERGAIEHEWFRKYLAEDGSLWRIGGGRPRGEGMPGLGFGHDAPGFPRVGDALSVEKRKKSGLENAVNTQSWYSTWGRDTLGVTAQTAAHLTRSLFQELAKAQIVEAFTTGSGATAYGLAPERIWLEPVNDEGLQEGHYRLSCEICEQPVTGIPEAIDQLNNGPCTSGRCHGTLRRAASKTDNYYRKLYRAGDMRRIVAREHTGLLKDELRLRYETDFKASASKPDAPNVLVATPTLEMGIDIGDLSTVMLAGLPRSVANYLQRVGRAGRLTGNALNLAFVMGRGEQLPRLADPLSVIEGAVRPPATYLNAEEILQRQYLASVLDRMAGTVGAEQPRSASDALKSVGAGSFIGEVVSSAETNATQYVSEFLNAFDGLEKWAIEGLTRWASPVDGTGTSPLAAFVYSAARRWNELISQLGHRIEMIETTIPGLKEKANHPAAPDEDKVDYRAAVAAVRGLRDQLKKLRTDHWVSALEGLGILPNYTLLDDSVELDVAITWYDPDELSYKSSTESFERGAGIAIRELVPGATFYAQGLEISIDAVDLGADGSHVHEWQLCPACGFARNLSYDEAVKACPRCGATGIADTGQRVPIVALQRVSAEVRRDESTITDRSDDRLGKMFTVNVSADIDPSNIEKQWYVDGGGLAVKYCRDLVIRWINYGMQGRGGLPREIAGRDLRTPLFRLCRLCGKLDRSTNENSRTEHRAWCPNRSLSIEDVKQVALLRELKTQGIVLRMPPTITMNRAAGILSFMAALQLGIRHTFGGSPDHLSVAAIVDPVLSDGSANQEALLLHDSVPGGTGYLADFADPDRLRRILDTAWEVLRKCPCAGEGLEACHRCLLPFVRGRDSRVVSRALAEQALRELLCNRQGEPYEWEIVNGEVPQADPIEILELRFREVMHHRFERLGASVTRSIDENGQRLTATLGGGDIWVLREQVPLGGVKPDFVLERFGDPQKIAIFTDGMKYHASVQHNRIADDARKRRGLREAGYLVFGVTWDDVETAGSATGKQASMPTWWRQDVAAGMAQNWSIPAHALAHVTQNPIDQLMSYVQDPSVLGTWQRIAEGLPALLWDGQTFHDTGNGALDSWAASVLAGNADGIGRRSQDNTIGLLNRVGAVALAGRSLNQKDYTASLILDDRDETLASEAFHKAWTTWLAWSNLLGTAAEGQQAFIGALSEIEEQLEDFLPITPPIGEAWTALLKAATLDERDVLEQLAQLPSCPLPELGLEVGDGVPVAIAWPEIRLAHPLGLTEDDIQDLAESGWETTPADVTETLAVIENRKA